MTTTECVAVIAKDTLYHEKMAHDACLLAVFILLGILFYEKILRERAAEKRRRKWPPK